MNGKFKRFFSALIAAIITIMCIPVSASAATPSYTQIVNAATAIIKTNEGEYNTVVKNDNGAMSIGFIGWHATNALNLLKDIIAKNPSQALSILGSSLYNEVITSGYWETRLASSSEASAISVLISTSEGKAVQDATAKSYISGYVTHGQKLGITEPEGLVFFADYQNQNGYSGAESFFYSVRSSYGTVNLGTLYNGSSKNSRRTRTYNFCAKINWSLYSGGTSAPEDTKAPEILNVVMTELSEKGYTISCDVKDNKAVTSVHFAVYYKDDGQNAIKWYEQVPSGGKASHSVDINEFSSRAGDYCTFIYAFDAAGNYAYVELNTITVPSAAKDPELSLTVSSNMQNAEKGSEIRWNAAASNGSGSYQYSFQLYKDGVLIDRRNYLDYSNYSYTAKETGSYTVVVNVLDSADGKTASITSSSTDVFEPIVINSFTANKPAALLGEMILFTVSASGGEGELRYAYTVYHDDTIIYSGDYSNAFRYPLKATEGGVYSVTVNIKDENSQVKSCKSQDITVIRPFEAGNVSFSKVYAITGSSVNCSVEIAGGTGSYTCVFSIYKNGDLVITSEEIDSETFTFTVPAAGSYTAVVTVTDADSTVTETSGGKLTAEDKPQLGDANCDGTVNSADARYALRCAASLETPCIGSDFSADVNGDGKITATDARIILRVSAQLQSF